MSDNTLSLRMEKHDQPNKPRTMKKSLQSLVLLLMALMVPVTATAAYEQLADGVYQDGSTLYITSGVTSLGDLQVNPSVVYSFAAVPPTCSNNTFSGYSGTLHMPPTSYGAYFITDYWCNFANMVNDAVEPTGINLNNADVELIIGTTFDIIATVAPYNASVKDVDWTTSNPLVATVSDGTITALAAGECDIIASCLDKQAICHVIVADPTSVTLDETNITIEQTKQVTLTATVLPESSASQNVTWSTTNALIATVEDGVVTGVGLGECDIIASYLDKQAVCHVTVVEPIIDITLVRHHACLRPNHDMLLTPTMSPWPTDLIVTSSNPMVAAARLINGKIQVVGLTEGITMIIVGSIDGKAIPDTCTVSVHSELGDVNCDGFVNISDLTHLIDLLLGDESISFNSDKGDVNEDGYVNISDVTHLIDNILRGVNFSPLENETFTVNGVSFTMVGVKGGTFSMGATSEQGWGDPSSEERPAHKVTLSSYSIGQTEVTQELWVAVMGYNPSSFTSANGYSDNLQRPVEHVSWYDCKTFITKLNELTDLTFRLPTEAEWEYAARGGNRSQQYKYAGSNSINDVAWYYVNAGDQSSVSYGPHTVGTKASNELDLYDMSGNVAEWCQDWKGSYSSAAQINPTGPESGSARVVRGGGYNAEARYCRVSTRVAWIPPTVQPNGTGFRLAL